MTNEELIAIAKIIISSTNDPNDAQGLNAEACEFLRVYGGKGNSFLKTLLEVRYVNRNDRLLGVKRILEAYVRYLEKGLSTSMSPERRVQIDTVSDYLGQAEELLANPSFHGASSAVLIGASLEEFLRGWCEAEDLKYQHSTLDGYTKALRENDFINKQDAKDITAWAGIRNNAAHGHWQLVEDKQRIRIMLEGVKLFIKSYTS